MKIIENHIIQRAYNKSILLDYYINATANKKPVIIFAHGYKGFKDWGAWTLMGKAFANAGFCFIKFNFSHNGGTIENPIDFPDLEAFGNNNYSKEIEDLNDVIEWTKSNLSDTININEIYLLGHSRAGGIVSIVASQNKNIKKLITLASVSDYKSRFPTGDKLNNWKENGVFYVKNGRTKQEMPHYLQFLKDFEKNKKQLSIKNAIEKLTIPHLIIHGENDETVNITEAYNLKSWNNKAQLYILRKANHTFGAYHPWKQKKLPQNLRRTVQCCINFYKKSDN